MTQTISNGDVGNFDSAEDTVAIIGKFQRIKIDIGAAGVSVPLVAGQTTKANSVPVTLASDQGDLAVAPGSGWASAKKATDPIDGSTEGVVAWGDDGTGKCIALKQGVQVGDLSTLATGTKQDTTNTEIGIVTESAPASDTASSGLNGRLQRIAQRITSLIALLPSALTGGGNLKAALVESTATVTVGGSVTSNPAASDNYDPVLGKTFITKSVDITASQTGAAVWTPTTGKKFVITDYDLSAKTAGDFTLFDGTDDTAHRVCKWSLAATGGAVRQYRKPRESATANNVLKYTSGAVITGSLTVNGYEI